jgi:RimJ/RimL family protein N-acetyltransferase
MLAGPAYRIVTDRLILRCYDPRDAPALKTAVDASLDHLAEMPWSREEPQTLDQKIALLRRFRGLFDLGQDFVYGIFDRDDATVLGGTGLHPRVGERAREIGYWIHVAHVNRGLATEAAAALTRVGFELERLARIEIHCGPHNARSAAVARKLGYIHDATLRERAVDTAGNPRDTMIWTLFAADFPQSPGAGRKLEAFDAAGRRIL